MRKIRIALAAFVLCLLSGATFATIGIFSGQPAYYAIALWAFALSFAISFSFILRIYQRFLTRMRTANELLKETKIIQERRYEQLAKRLDDLSASISVRAHERGKLGDSGSSMPRNEVSGLEELNARLQRAERRILGTLENELLLANEHIRQLETLISFSKDKLGDTNGGQ